LANIYATSFRFTVTFTLSRTPLLATVQTVGDPFPMLQAIV
jgi:hypothetical protein